MITFMVFTLIGFFVGCKINKRKKNKDPTVVLIWSLLGLIIGLFVATWIQKAFVLEHETKNPIKMIAYKSDVEIGIDVYLIDYGSFYTFLKENEKGLAEQGTVYDEDVLSVNQEERANGIIKVFKKRFKSKLGVLFALNLSDNIEYEIFVPKNSILKAKDE